MKQAHKNTLMLIFIIIIIIIIIVIIIFVYCRLFLGHPVFDSVNHILLFNVLSSFGVIF